MDEPTADAPSRGTTGDASASEAPADAPARETLADASTQEAAAEDSSHEVHEADLLPWRGTADGVTITVYIVTGRHGGLTIPESFCRECNLFVRAADVAAERVDADVDVSVVSWWTHVLGALRHGGYHPPVMVVDGTRLCQGHDVPTPDEVVEAIEAGSGE